MRKRRTFVGAVLVLLAALPRPASAALEGADVELTLIETLDQPVALATLPDDPKLYVAEKGGRVQALEGGDVEEILDISGRVSNANEQGLLGLAFSPTDDELFINFTNRAGDTVVRGYPFDGDHIDDADGYRIIKIDQPFANHNGGNLAFGPDGYLYIGMGDGGNQDDPGNRAQKRTSLLGKMLRIDPQPGGGYENPIDNPFVGRKGRDEIWAKGLRNPWRFSFDRTTGDLWIGDVGGGHREEVDHQLASSTGRENYGWRLREGTRENLGPPPPSHDPPVFEYKHAGSANCAITGGYVYRGSAISDLAGAYLFADFCVGTVRAFMPNNPAGTVRDLVDSSSVSSFGEDNDGELYVLSLGGSVYRIDPP